MTVSAAAGTPGGTGDPPGVFASLFDRLSPLDLLILYIWKDRPSPAVRTTLPQKGVRDDKYAQFGRIFISG
jgi:hypothetical protein